MRRSPFPNLHSFLFRCPIIPKLSCLEGAGFSDLSRVHRLLSRLAVIVLFVSWVGSRFLGSLRTGGGWGRGDLVNLKCALLVLCISRANVLYFFQCFVLFGFCICVVFPMPYLITGVLLFRKFSWSVLLPLEFIRFAVVCSCLDLLCRPSVSFAPSKDTRGSGAERNTSCSFVQQPLPWPQGRETPKGVRATLAVLPERPT